MRVPENSGINRVTDIDLARVDAGPGSFPRESTIYNWKSAEKVVGIVAGVVKIRDEKHVNACIAQHRLERVLPARVWIRGSKCQSATVKGTDKRLATVAIVVAVSDILFQHGDKLGRVGEMGHVQAEEELEFGARRGIEQRADGAGRPVLSAHQIERKGVEAGGDGLLDVRVGVVLGDAANLGSSVRSKFIEYETQERVLPCNVQRPSLLPQPACKGMIARERDLLRVS